LEPLTVRVKSGLPATADSGLIPVIAGTGFRIVRVNSLVALATG
jgi:hypothetical protein